MEIKNHVVILKLPLETKANFSLIQWTAEYKAFSETAPYQVEVKGGPAYHPDGCLSA